MTDSVPGPIDFSRFAAGLAATAGATLQQVEKLLAGDGEPAPDDPAGDAPADRAATARQGLIQARQLIDTLAMLETKTRGNLTTEEEGLLRGVLTDLRVGYVRVADRVGGATT